MSDKYSPDNKQNLIELIEEGIQESLSKVENALGIESQSQKSNMPHLKTSKKCQSLQQTNAQDEKLLSVSRESEFLQEEIEYWQELTESLKLELLQKEQEIQQLKQELYETNKELQRAFVLDQTSFAEAKELANEILKNQKDAGKCLSELLTAIYGSSVQQEELLQIEQRSIQLQKNLETALAYKFAGKFDKYRTELNEFLTEFKELGARFRKLRAYTPEKTRFAHLKEKLKTKNQVDSPEERIKESRQRLETSKEIVKKSKESMRRINSCDVPIHLQ